MHRLVIGLVTLLGLTAASVVAGYLLVFSAASDRLAALAPADTAAYVNVYLQPSTGQQMNLSELVGRLPGFADDATLDDKVDQIVENLLSGTGLDYAADIKPWLGDQLALAAWPDEAAPDGSRAVVLAAVKDLPAARDAVARLAADAGVAFTTRVHRSAELHVAAGTAYAFVGEALALGETAEGVAAIVDVADGGEGSLAEVAAFRDAMRRVAPDHLASAYVDLGAMARASGVEDDDIDSLGTAAAALVAEEDGLRLSGSVPFDVEAAQESARDRFALGTEPTSLAQWMPDETVASLVVFGLSRTLEDAEAVMGATDGADEALGLLDTIRALAAFGLGIDLDADVLPLLDREVAIAVNGFDGELPRGQLLLRPDDATAASSSIDSLVERLVDAGGERHTEDHEGTEITVLTIPDAGEVAYAIVDGIVIIGLDADDVAASIHAHASGSSLAATDAYRRTFEVAGTRAGTEAFVDVGTLSALAGLAGMTDELPDDARDILSALGTFGLTLPSRVDQIEFHAVLTVTDRGAE